MFRLSLWFEKIEFLFLRLKAYQGLDQQSGYATNRMAGGYMSGRRIGARPNKNVEGTGEISHVYELGTEYPVMREAIRIRSPARTSPLLPTTISSILYPSLLNKYGPSHRRRRWSRWSLGRPHSP